jgi:hypothetical protein
VQRYVEQQQDSLKWITQGLSNSGRKRSKLSLSSNPAIMILLVFWIPGYPGPPAPRPHHRHIFSPGRNQRPKLRKKTLTRRRLVRRTTTETAKDQKTSSRAPLVRRGGTPTSAQHVCMQSKKITGRRPRTAHATPDREETNFRCACLKRHSGCWPPP